jgi:hypothetical protein
MAVLTYRATELRDLAVRRCWFGIESGWHDGVEVRGEDWVIPAKAGQTEGARKDHVRVIRLRGLVLGTDEANWKAVCAELETIFDPALTSGSLVVTTPYKGLAAGTRTISAKTVNYRTVERVPNHVTEYDVTLHAIGDPPDWT